MVSGGVVRGGMDGGAASDGPGRAGRAPGRAGDPTTPCADPSPAPPDVLGWDELGWDELVAHATLGTARRPDLPAGTVAGHDVPAEGGTERRLLSAAAMLHAARRASRRPPAGGEIDPRWHPPPPDPRPLAPGDAVALLDVLLDGVVVTGVVQRQLVARWLSRASAAGWRLPNQALPQVLDGWGGHLPATARAVLGTTGTWLAGLNPRWDDVLLDDDRAEAALRPGADGGSTPRVRARAAAHLWRSDPRRGRAVLSAAWPRLPASTRAAVLLAVADLVHAEDEGWLEAAREDGPTAVSRAASTALRRVPGSRLAIRMARRLPQVVGRASGAADGPTVRPLDATPSPSDLADASEDPPATGRPAWWRQQVIAAAPLSAWGAVVDTPAGAVAVQAATPWATPMVAAAIVLQRDIAWADLLLAHLLGRGDPDPVAARPLSGGATGGAWPGLPTDPAQVVSQVLGVVPGPWGPRQVDAVWEWALGAPAPATALTAVREVLLDRAGPRLDALLASAGVGLGTGRSPSSAAGPGHRSAAPDLLAPSQADALAHALERMRTVRALQRAIDEMTDLLPDGKDRA